MAEWIDELAEAFGTEPFTGAESNQLLGVARDIAHSTERKAVPLASFLIGEEVQRRVAAGATRGGALAGVLDEAAALLPAKPAED